jgi:hypothetical protein
MKMKIYYLIILLLLINISNEINETLPIKNMCGKIGDFQEPINQNDCIKGKTKFGGKCCFIKFLRNETIYNNYSLENDLVLIKHSSCVEIPFINKDEIKLANIIAKENGYKLEIKCCDTFLQLNLILLFFILIF